MSRKEFGTTFGIVVGAFFFEWIESPAHRLWLGKAVRALTGLGHINNAGVDERISRRGTSEGGMKWKVLPAWL